MKYIVITDEPIVLEKIKLQGHNEIRELTNFDYIGESATFISATNGIICPICGNCHPCFAPIRYCSYCGCANNGTV